MLTANKNTCWKSNQFNERFWDKLHRNIFNTINSLVIAYSLFLIIIIALLAELNVQDSLNKSSVELVDVVNVFCIFDRIW